MLICEKLVWQAGACFPSVAAKDTSAEHEAQAVAIEKQAPKRASAND